MRRFPELFRFHVYVVTYRPAGPYLPTSRAFLTLKRAKKGAIEWHVERQAAERRTFGRPFFNDAPGLLDIDRFSDNQWRLVNVGVTGYRCGLAFTINRMTVK